MPLYQIKKKRGKKIEEVFMSYSSLQEFLEKNTNYQLVPCAPAIVSGIAGVTHKVDSGFTDVLKRIGEANPHSPLGHEYGDKGVKATKTREAVVRQKQRQGNAD